MVEKKHKPPSRERYEESNPNWTARLPVELKDEITTYLENSGQSRRDFMAIALKKQVADYEQVKTQSFNQGVAIGQKQGYSQGHNDGFAKGKEEGRREGKQIGIEQGTRECQIWYFCSLCHCPKYITPGSQEHKAIIDFFGYHGWAHMECARRHNFIY